jgi:hypothetical protein
MATQSSQFQTVTIDLSTPTDTNKVSLGSVGRVRYKQDCYVVPNTKTVKAFSQLQTASTYGANSTWERGGSYYRDNYLVTHAGFCDTTLGKPAIFGPFGVYLSVGGNTVHFTKASNFDTFLADTQHSLIQLVRVPSGDGPTKRIRLKPLNAFHASGFTSAGTYIEVKITGANTYDIYRQGVLLTSHVIPVGGLATHTAFELQFEADTGYTINDVFEWRRTDGFGISNTGTTILELGFRPLSVWWTRFGSTLYFVGPGGVLCGLSYHASALVAYTVGSRNIFCAGVYSHEGHLFAIDAYEVTTTNQTITTAFNARTQAQVLWSDLNNPEHFYSTLSNEADVFIFATTANPQTQIFGAGDLFGALTGEKRLTNFAGVFVSQGQLYFDVGGVLYRGQYVGLPLVYQFVEVGETTNLPGTLQATQDGVFALTPTDVVRFSGVGFERFANIANTLTQFFPASLDPQNVIQTLKTNPLSACGFDYLTQSVLWQVSGLFGQDNRVLFVNTKTGDQTFLFVPTTQFFALYQSRTGKFPHYYTASLEVYAGSLIRTYRIPELTGLLKTMKLFVQPICVASNLRMVRELLSGLLVFTATNYEIRIRCWSGNRLFDIVDDAWVGTPRTDLAYQDFSFTTANNTTDQALLDTFQLRTRGRFFGFQIEQLATNCTALQLEGLEVTLSKFDADK